MSNKIRVTDSNYVLENINRTIVFTDAVSTDYRISFLNDGGIIINKCNDFGRSEQISVLSKTSNEIHVV